MGLNLTTINSLELAIHIQCGFLWCSCFTPMSQGLVPLLFKNVGFPHWFSLLEVLNICLCFVQAS